MSIAVMKDMANYIDTLGGDSKKYRQAIEQAEKQEPVACVGPWHDARLTLIPRYSHQTFEHNQPLYATPPAQEFVCSTGLCHYKAQREFVGLTDEEVESTFHEVDEDGIGLFNLCRAIEAKLKDKNT